MPKQYAWHDGVARWLKNRRYQELRDDEDVDQRQIIRAARGKQQSQHSQSAEYIAENQKPLAVEAIGQDAGQGPHQQGRQHAGDQEAAYGDALVAGAFGVCDDKRRNDNRAEPIPEQADELRCPQFGEFSIAGQEL